MYKRSIGGWAKHWDFILIDAICLQIAFILSYWLRYQGFFDLVRRNAYRTTAVVMLLLSAIVAILFNTMHNVLTRGLWLEIKSTFWQTVITFGGIVLLLFTAKDSSHVSRIVMYLTMGIYAVLAISTRLLYRKFLLTHKREKPKRSMLLVGDEVGIERALKAFEAHPEEGVSIKNVVRVSGSHSEDPVKLDNAADYIRNEWIDEVYIACADVSLVPSSLISACSEMAVTVHQQIFMGEELSDRQWVEKIAKQPVLTTSVNIPRPKQLLFKRCVDIIAGLFLSILAIVVIILSTPFIFLSSPGPILIRFERIGQNGRKFHMFLIRTMYMDAASRDANKRVIKGIGSFLRRWSLDQLPKGFNVLFGSMSLVGTRAPSVSEWEGYKYHHRARLACKPGIVGLFHVFGGGKALTFEEATEIDTEYITNWSLGLDWQILFSPGSLRNRYRRESDGDKPGKTGVE